MSVHPAPETLLGQPKEPLVPQSVRPRSSLHIHVLCVWNKSINNITSYTMRNILITTGDLSLRKVHALIQVSQFTLFSLYLCSTRRQNTSRRGLELGRIVRWVYQHVGVGHVYFMFIV